MWKAPHGHMYDGGFSDLSSDKKMQSNEAEILPVQTYQYSPSFIFIPLLGHLDLNPSIILHLPPANLHALPSNPRIFVIPVRVVFTSQGKT